MFKIGILGGADIAYKMFIPALNKIDNIKCIGIASNTKEKREKFLREYNIPIFSTYEEIINNSNIDGVYIPLPPTLHYKWAKLALENGKHVFLEKPSTINYNLTKELVELSNKNNLVLFENYMFQYHSQLEKIMSIISSGQLGKIRLYKSSFGFPKRAAEDFRYNKDLGGGALLDAGGYVVKLATLLLGKSIKVLSAESQKDDNYDVDIFDSVMFANDEGTVLQGSFGMDCQYQCNLEVWGSKAKLSTGRIFTAPDEFEPTIIIEEGSEKVKIKLKSDNHFKKSIEHFLSAIENKDEEKSIKDALLLQSRLVSQVSSIMEGENG
ncbi:MAG: Gfo/Idh/MocA family protein [Clostridium sp.]